MKYKILVKKTNEITKEEHITQVNILADFSSNRTLSYPGAAVKFFDKSE